jgi:hypothetical protein
LKHINYTYQEGEGGIAERWDWLSTSPAKARPDNRDFCKEVTFAIGGLQRATGGGKRRRA